MKISCAYFVLCTIICAFHVGIADCGDSNSTTIWESSLTEDGKLNFTQLVKKYGHTVEEYDVTTEDGYILTVFRIPGEKPPVLLFHGIGDSCDTFMIRGNISMVTTLADKGYDVYVANNRGNLYGRRHVTLNPDTDKEFWNYSFHEIGYYDLAAIIDFIRSKRGVDSIASIGHSQGATNNFVLTSSRPEYNNRIKIFIALGPTVYLDALEPPLSVLATAGPAISAALEQAGIEELFRNQSAASELIKATCTTRLLGGIICNNLVLYPGVGYDANGTDPEFLQGVAFGHYPRGTSRKSVTHFAQVHNSGKFAQYDYGTNQNMQKYGSANPPEYNLTAVTTKVAMLVAKNDALSKLSDDVHLNNSLPNVVSYQVLEPEEWNHVDFVWGKYTPQYFYPILFELLEKFYN